MSFEGELEWKLSAYGNIIRGDENTSEDQVAEAFSPRMAKRLAYCFNEFHGIDDKQLSEKVVVDKELITAVRELLKEIESSNNSQLKTEYIEKFLPNI